MYVRAVTNLGGSPVRIEWRNIFHWALLRSILEKEYASIGHRTSRVWM